MSEEKKDTAAPAKSAVAKAKPFWVAGFLAVLGIGIWVFCIGLSNGLTTLGAAMSALHEIKRELLPVAASALVFAAIAQWVFGKKDH